MNQTVLIYGNKYVGEWMNGKKNGQRTYTWSDGSMYVGEYKDGRMNGQGTFTHGKGKYEGQKYVGEWKDDEYHGQGTNIVQNKNFINDKGEWQEVKLEGEWKNGEQHGQGSQKGKDWEAVGEFKDGERWNVTSFYNDRNIGTQVVNGVQQKITK